MGGVLLRDVVASRALCVIVADIVVLPLVGRVFVVRLAEQSHDEVGLKWCVTLCITAHPGGGLASVLSVTTLHVLGDAYVSALVDLILDTVDVV